MKTVLKSLLAVCIISIGSPAVPAALGGTISSCTNGPNYTSGGTVYTQFVCSLYNDVSSYTIDLTPLMTHDGASIWDNLVGPGYVTVINGDPLTLPDNSTGLWNRNLWEAVLFWEGDQDQGTASDSLTVYWPGAFPDTSTIQNLDQFLYPGDDSGFFIPSTGFETVYTPNANNEYDIFNSVPEPATMLLLGPGLAMLGGVVARRRRGARRAA